MKTVRTPRTARLSLLFWLSLVGLIGTLAWGLFSYQELQDRLAEMPRAAVPGQVDFEVVEPETLTVFYEEPNTDAGFIVQSSGSHTLDVLPVALVVTGPSGDGVAFAHYGRDLRFDHDGRVLTAIAVIDASTSGTYAVQASGDVPALAQVSVGRVVDGPLVTNFVGLVGLFVISVVGVAVPGAMLVSERGRRASSTASEPPLVGV